MNIYVAHSNKTDFKSELYIPIRRSKLGSEHNFVLPHEYSDEPFNSKEFLSKKAELLIAEVSGASTGMGIELGWADAFNVPIVCIYKKGAKLSSSLKVVTNTFIEYSSSEELILELEKAIEPK